MNADEKLREFLILAVRSGAGSGYLAPPVKDLNNASWWQPRWPPEMSHLRTCAGLAVTIDGQKIDRTGYCETCVETVYRTDFTASCPHGHAIQAMWWDDAYSIDKTFEAMDYADFDWGDQ